MAINKEFLGKTNLEPLFDQIKIKKVELAWTHTARHFRRPHKTIELKVNSTKQYPEKTWKNNVDSRLASSTAGERWSSRQIKKGSYPPSANLH